MATSIGVKMQMDGAAQFKADLQQITQRSKELAAEMKAVASGSDDQAAKQKILTQQIENARSKIDKLNDKYKAQEKALQESNQKLEEAKKVYGEDSEEVKKLTLEVTKQETALSKTKTEINKATDELNKFEKEADEAGNETKELASAEKQAGDASGKLKDGFTVLKGAMSSLVADGIRKAVDGFKDLMTAGPAFADQILTLSQKTHLATDTLQELSYMSGLVDVDVSTVAGSLSKLTKTMASAKGGTGAAADTFKQLGVSVTDSNGQLRNSNDVFFDTIDALGHIENETERDVVAMSIFGKSAKELNPMIEAGSDALRGFADEAHDMGYVLDKDAIKSLGRVQDEFDRFQKQTEAIKYQIASGVAPAIERGMKKLQEVVKSIDWKKVGKNIGEAFERLVDAMEWIVDHGALIKGTLTGMVAAMATQKILAFASSLKAATVAQMGLNAAAEANPYVLLISAIVGAGAALLSWQKSLFDAAEAADRSWQMTHRLTDAAREHISAVEEMSSAYADAKAARESSIDTGLAEVAHVQSLYDELHNLADANGVVADSDKSRAQFILNELNNALGTEYTMTGNVIDQYGELSGAIEDVIAKKKAEVILAAQEDAYREAITNRDEAERLLMDTESQIIDLTNQRAENQQRMDEILASSNGYILEHKDELGKLAEQNQELDASLSDLNSAFEKQAETVDQYAYDVMTYEGNMTKALEGDYDTIEYVSWETAKAQGTASREASKTVKANADAMSNAWMTNLGDMLTKTTGAQVEFRDAGNGMVQMYANGVAQGQPMTQKQVMALNQTMMNEANKNYNQMRAAGEHSGEGMAQGLKSSQSQSDRAVQDAVNSIYNKTKGVNLYGTGSTIMSSLANGLSASSWSVKSVLNNITSSIPKWKGPAEVDKKLLTENGKLIMQSLVSGLDSGYGQVRSTLQGMTADISTYMAPGGSASVINDSRSNSYVINVYGAEGQDVNELADLISEKIQMGIERNEAVYA